MVSAPAHLNLPPMEETTAAWTAGRRAAMTYQPRSTSPHAQAATAADEVLKGCWEKGWLEGAVLRARLSGK